METEHPGVAPAQKSFKFSVTGSYRSALDRQLSEAIKIARATAKRVTILNSKLEFNRCMIPTLVTEDKKPKPYQQNQIRYERDPDEEEEDTWDDENNPNKRNRNQDLRRKQPTKRRKPNKPGEEHPEETSETKTEKRKPKPREERPTKIRKMFTDDHLRVREGTKNDQILTSIVSPNQKHKSDPPLLNQTQILFKMKRQTHKLTLLNLL